MRPQNMLTDRERTAILEAYAARGARRYQALLPAPVLTYFKGTMVDSVPLDSIAPVLELLRPGAPPHQAPVKVQSELDEIAAGPIEGLVDRLQGSAEAHAVIDQTLELFHRRMNQLEKAADPLTVDLAFEAAAIANAIHTNSGGALPWGDDREACDRAMIHWTDVDLATFFLGLVAELGRRGYELDTRNRRRFLPAVLAFRDVTRRFLPGDRAMFTTYYRDQREMWEVAALRRVENAAEYARHQAFVERVAGWVEEAAPKVAGLLTMSPGDDAFDWLSQFVGSREQRRAH